MHVRVPTPQIRTSTAVVVERLQQIPIFESNEISSFIPVDDIEYHTSDERRVMTIQHSRIAPAKCETLTLLDMETATTESYKLGKLLGAGAYGSVYAFHCGDKKIAVKVPQDTWSEYKLGETECKWECAEKEFKFLCRAYPYEGPYALQSLHKEEDGKQLHSWRLMMPFVTGELISHVLQKAKDPLLAAQVVLRAAEELHKLHADRNLCHGDIRPGNILINVTDGKVEAHLIDFAFAYDMSGPATYMGSDEYNIVAPERHDELPSMAHPSQDIWSLGRTISWSMPLALKFSMRPFPSVSKFVEDAAQVDPDKRPALPDFIEALRMEIQTYQESRKYVTNNRFFREDRVMRQFHNDLERIKANHLMKKF